MMTSVIWSPILLHLFGICFGSRRIIHQLGGLRPWIPHRCIHTRPTTSLARVGHGCSRPGQRLRTSGFWRFLPQVVETNELFLQKFRYSTLCFLHFCFWSYAIRKFAQLNHVLFEKQGRVIQQLFIKIKTDKKRSRSRENRFMHGQITHSNKSIIGLLAIKRRKWLEIAKKNLSDFGRFFL